jgi:hypothetical protein
MKNVKYITEKSRPNLFREVSGTMKAIITLLLVLFVCSSTFGQTIDWTNAPLNPVPVFYTANHYNLKGPIKEFKGESMTGESLYLQFNEQGKLVLKIVQGLAGTSKLKYVYQYDTKGNLISQTSSMLDKNGNASYESKADIKVDSKGLVTQLGGFIYSYDKNNRLVLCTAKDQNGKENYRQEFTYNNLGQVISEKITDPHVATGVMEVEEFKFAYTKRNTGGWDITMHVYKEGKLATKGSIPLITSSFVRQKREQIFNNPQNFSFDEIGLEAFKPDYVKVMIDQYNNLRGKFLIKMNKDAYPVNITYYKNELSIAKYKEITTAGANTSFQTTETRYYNGKYTKETALQKANDFFNRTNGEKITFTKMEKKSDYQFVGNWIIKGADESLQSKIEYLFEDDGLKIKINEIVLNDKYGTLKMDKNHKDEAVRKTAENLYTSINDLFVKAVFVFLDINNNTTFKQTSTTAGSNTAVKDYSKDKITASYNENESLYARKIDNATVYFYQNNKRINQPLHYAIIEDGNNLRLFTTYTKDYYSAYALNDMLPEKLYPLAHRNGVFYLYINQSNGNFSFNYQGKALSSAQYELYKSKGDYTVVKVKSDNTIYLFKSDLTKAAISNSQSKGVLVHFADKSSIFVESGKPTEPTKWKIEKENDKYYLFNSSGSIKYSLSDYEKSIDWGIYTIH